VESLDGKCVGEFLSTSEVIDFEKRIVQWCKAYALIAETIREIVVTVAIELQSKRRPSRHSQIAKSELSIDEVEVIMEAFGLLATQSSFAGHLVVPGRV